MRIRGQDWIENSSHLLLHLNEPYWGAYQKYGWEYGIEGISISQEALYEAMKFKKLIYITVGKYGTYKIKPQTAIAKGKTFIARDHKKLYCIPRTAFTRITQQEQ